MEHGAAGVLLLQFLLLGQCLEGVRGVRHGQLRGIGVVRLLCGACLQDFRVACAVLAGEAVGRAFSRGGFQVVEVAGSFLCFDEPVVEVVE